jgi:voltage-gated potassium channel
VAARRRRGRRNADRRRRRAGDRRVRHHRRRSKNLVITLSAKQLNGAARVVYCCHDVSFTEKRRRVGADSIVSPDFTRGMRIASSRVRPHVTPFLDEMLRS